MIRPSQEARVDGAGLVYSSGPQKKQKCVKSAGAAPIQSENAITLPKMTKGSVHAQWVKCGKPGCRCARGELHGPYFYLFWRENGRLRKKYVRRSDLLQVLSATTAYRMERRGMRIAWRRLRELREVIRGAEVRSYGRSESN